jgi:hypothetical protein
VEEGGRLGGGHDFAGQGGLANALAIHESVLLLGFFRVRSASLTDFLHLVWSKYRSRQVCTV